MENDEVIIAVKQRILRLRPFVPPTFPMCVIIGSIGRYVFINDNEQQ